jgi:hypothetical protein
LAGEQSSSSALKYLYCAWDYVRNIPGEILENGNCPHISFFIVLVNGLFLCCLFACLVFLTEREGDADNPDWFDISNAQPLLLTALQMFNLCLTQWLYCSLRDKKIHRGVGSFKRSLWKMNHASMHTLFYNVPAQWFEQHSCTPYRLFLLQVMWWPVWSSTSIIDSICMILKINNSVIKIRRPSSIQKSLATV